MTNTPREPRDDSGQSAGFGFLTQEERMKATRRITPRKKAPNPFLGEMVVLGIVLVSFMAWYVFI